MGLPGSILKHITPVGDCEDCMSAPATLVMQGETDSFGFEQVHLCEACWKRNRNAALKDLLLEEKCDWCKTSFTGVRDFRDPDEGMSGPVYRVCPACRGKCHKQQDEELSYLREQNARDSGQDYWGDY